MSEASKITPIENAADIIERFGGLRPMSAKTGVAVTTIQGWKKRGVIPANRVQDILQAANEHGIDLGDIARGAPVPLPQAASVTDKDDVIGVEEGEADVATQEIAQNLHQDGDRKEHNVAQTPESEPHPVVTSIPVAEKKPEAEARDYTELAMETERRAVTKSAIFATIVIVLILGAVIALLMPRFQKQTDRVAELEQELSQMQRQQTMFKGLVPENWNEQLEQLRRELEQAKGAVAPAIEQAKNAASALVGGGNIEQRVEKLQSYVNEITQSTSLSGLYARFDKMRQNVAEREYLEQATKELSALYARLDSATAQDPDAVNALLEAESARSEALGVALGDVPPEDMQAAAMLLAMTQMRATLARENVPFEDDLELLMRMVSPENKELRASLERLAPYAKQGVLTPDGLSREFRGLAGDAVAASLRGEDVSLMDRARARMNDFLAIEKDGELVTGTPTQATINKAQKELDEGNVASALGLLKEKLSTAELEPLLPWISKAQGFLNAQDAKNAINQSIELHLGSGYLGGSQLLKVDRTQQ